jgi:hypothetical protein
MVPEPQGAAAGRGTMIVSAFLFTALAPKFLTLQRMQSVVT